MSRTDEYLDRARTALDHLRAQVDALRVQADLGEAEARDRLHQGIQQVRDLLQDARERLDQAQAAATDAWDQLAGQAEKAIDAAGNNAAMRDGALGQSGVGGSPCGFRGVMRSTSASASLSLVGCYAYGSKAVFAASRHTASPAGRRASWSAE